MENRLEVVVRSANEDPTPADHLAAEKEFKQWLDSVADEVKTKATGTLVMPDDLSASSFPLSSPLSPTFESLTDHSPPQTSGSRLSLAKAVYSHTASSLLCRASPPSGLPSTSPSMPDVSRALFRNFASLSFTVLAPAGILLDTEVLNAVTRTSNRQSNVTYVLLFSPVPPLVRLTLCPFTGPLPRSRSWPKFTLPTSSTLPPSRR